MDAPFDLSAYQAHARAIAERFELRRAQFMRLFKIRVGIAALLLLTFPWWFGFISAWDLQHENIISAMGQTLINGFAAAILIGFIIIYAMMPIFRYRNHTVQFGSVIPGVDGVASQHVSLKSEIFSQLMHFFGNFTLHNERKLSLNRFHNAPHMPEFDEFVSEDYIEGQMSGVKVEMTEARLQIRTHKDHVSIFNGLMVIMDINNTNLELRGTFHADTVIIADRGHEMDYVASKYKNHRRLILPDSAYEHRFETFSTDESEAKSLVSSELLRSLLKLSDAVKSPTQQSLSLDEIVANKVTGFLRCSADGLSFVCVRLLLWLQTGSFQLRAVRHAAAAPFHTADDAKALNQYVHCAFFDDKIVVTVPYSHDLFQPDSLFKPPLNDEDIHMTFQLMSAISGIIDSVLSGLKKSQTSS